MAKNSSPQWPVSDFTTVYLIMLMTKEIICNRRKHKNINTTLEGIDVCDLKCNANFLFIHTHLLASNSLSVQAQIHLIQIYSSFHNTVTSEEWWIYVLLTRKIPFKDNILLAYHTDFIKHVNLLGTSGPSYLHRQI